MKKKEFPTAAVLSVVGEKLLGKFDKVHELIEFMADEPVFTHQLPRVADPCRKSLIQQFPALKDYEDSTVNEQNWEQWLEVQNKRYGETFLVEVMPKGSIDSKNPVAEMIELMDSGVLRKEKGN